MLSIRCLTLCLAPVTTGNDLADPIRLEADGCPIDSGEYVAHSGPLLYDFDGDGLDDLLVGNFKGHVQLFRNVGERRAPVYTADGLLEAEGEIVKIKNW